ncbi:protein TonB [Altererythrobacter atlanticus]|uniref:Gram-negative bacterial tonB protein n=2 Tax=Croceibacterium atlanticum TaxID=1267766 RepID=A0A0F7KP09_9SPHN|nr:energy transducer TonB [Croceibacterium atlanticum]AKH42248.1 Gram-negative bacterial tonB protein [Croceibacterium atlanticum]MBB5731024.1 protein TonB [Croceibacterium atlanticum]
MHLEAFASAGSGDGAPPVNRNAGHVAGAPGAIEAQTPPTISGGRYGEAHRPRLTVMAGIVLFHLVVIAVLATARYSAQARDREERLTTFSVTTPPPPPPAPAETPPEPATQQAAPILAPAPPIALPRPVPVAAAPVDLSISSPAPAAVSVQPPAPAAPPRAAAPAPVVPPDFSAAQLGNPGPSYPYLSRKAREEGVVMLKVLVSADGHAKQLQIEETSGFERLDKAAVKTVRKWRFLPASRAGSPCEAWVIVPVTFSLS